MNEAKMGDNIGVPFAQGVADRLELDYGQLVETARELLRDAEQMPVTVQGELDVSAIASMVKQLRDTSARAEAHRVAEKEPFMRAGDAVYAFFTKRVIEPLDRERKTLVARVDLYKQRELAAERERRRAEAEEARKQQEFMRKQREEAEAAVKRARSAETQEQRKAEAQQARVEQEIADAQAEVATLATMASATGMVGERFEGERSGQVGMRRAPVVFIDDVTKLDLEALRPYLKEDVLLTALRAWAKATNYQQQMPGATVGHRETTVVR